MAAAVHVHGVILSDWTRDIIGAAMEVHRTLGAGFLESVYKRALIHELHLRGMPVESEWEACVTYKTITVGKHRLDLVVGYSVIVELKALPAIADIHVAQALSYMKATGIPISLIINFGERSLAWKRLILTDHTKKR